MYHGIHAPALTHTNIHTHLSRQMHIDKILKNHLDLLGNRKTTFGWYLAHTHLC